MPYHVAKSSSCPDSKPWAVIKDSDGKVMGCHSSKEDAQRQIAAIHANEGASVGDTVDFAVSTAEAITGGYELDIAGMTGTKWEGILLVEGVETGDGREFVPNVVTWADLPLPLRRNIEDSHGGMPTTKTVLVGRIDEVWRNPENPLEIRGRGVFDDAGDNGAEAVRMVRGKFLKGISVDPDDIKEADVELVFPKVDENASEEEQVQALFAAPEKTIFHAGRLRAATLVDIPAFVEAQIWLVGDTEPVATAHADLGAAHFAALSDRTWNGPLHESRLRGRATVGMLRQSFAHVSAGGASTTSSSRFLHHEIDESGKVGTANMTAVVASMRTINAGRATTLSDGDRRAAYDHLAQHMRAAGLVPPPFEGESALTADGSYPERPPAEWFADPKFEVLTPLTVTEEGRVFGHGAAWDSCHTSFPGACTTAPQEGEHAYFRLGEAVCADGSRIAVGSITLGTGHAPVRGLTPSAAAEHYDNTGTVVALVASGEDDHGIWVAGAIRHGTPDSRVAELRAASLSGDWRRIGGKLRLVAFLAVNRPGFPVPRLSAFVSQQKQLSLVAAGVVTQDMRVAADDGARAAFERIARSIGRDPKSRMAELRARIGR